MPDTATPTVTANVRAELARRSLSGRSLSRDLGWSKSTTHRLLAGHRAFTVDELAAVAAYLDVPLGLLYGDLPAQRTAGGAA